MNIILAICGGIAAYKSVSLLRLLVKAGHEVQVVITPSGKQFITPVTLSALSQKPVVSEFFTANTGEWHSHVALGTWADLMIVAPATASTLAKMASGVADNMVVTTYLSARCPVWVAPAMDFDMMAHPSTQRNLQTLKSYGNRVIEPRSGFLASGLEGKGRMEEPEEIARLVEEYFHESQSLKGKKVLITAGPTREKIDPVRYISNFSTGKMGYALAAEARDRGAEVTLISGPVALEKPQGVKVVNVETALEMLQACEKTFPESDVAIMCAAVADYRPEEVASAKIHRSGHDKTELKLVQNPDIAATLGSLKRPGQLLIGFALETDHESQNARQKLKKKNLDFIVLNSLRTPGAGFATDTNQVTVISEDNSVEVPLKSKAEVAKEILDIVCPRIPQS